MLPNSIFYIFFVSLYKYYIMDLLKRVEIALDTIRPYLETDGGNVSIEEITPENIVRLRLLGSCGSCPMSIMTLKAGIEQAIKRAVPEITGVEAVNLTDIDDPAAVLPERLQ
jgi:Fe-S cluster biogenesis protein NfuA